ncbi:MAG: tyrosine-type recombinase/integrase [Bacilli bacterium]|nr:tyrosine-type recombinase/integrase [Bacilli bacterium]
MNHILDFLEYLEVIKKHSENTINSYKIDLIDFFNYTDKNILSVDREIVNGYMQYMYDKKISKSTISRKLSSLRTFYNYLVKNEVVDKNYFSIIKNPKKDNSLPKLVKEIDIDKMFLIPDIRNPIGQRNLLIIRLLYATGVRVSELVNICIKDIDFSERTIRILGKGSKERIVIYGNHTEEILDLYLNSGRYKLSKGNNDYLFLNKDGLKLSDRYVRKIIDDIIFKASIEMHVSPHMLRHTFATSMLNNGADLVNVKELLGHESLNTTSIYTHVSDDKIRDVYNKAHPRAK